MKAKQLLRLVCSSFENFKLTISDLLLDDHLLRRFGHRGSSNLLLHLLLMVQSCLLLGLVLQFDLLFLAWFVAVFVTAGMFPLVPATAANARPAHDTYGHLYVAAILLVDCFHFLQTLHFQVKSMYLLHQLTLSCSLNINPIQ